ncbi:MAG: hypothetical protein FRX49_12732 [Trebouxia sp. A1-2]|nr:MAG: hypothetical protein FRX49_12732 [Trebouxia sp. A1-2]
MTLSEENFTLGPSAEQSLVVNFTAASLLQGVYSTRICAYNQTETDTSSGLMPEPVGQIPVQATVLCSRLAASPASQSECSLNITQLALLKARDQPTSVFFEASMTFNAYPWPTWSSASGSLVVDQAGATTNFTQMLRISSNTASDVTSGANATGPTIAANIQQTTNASTCMLQQQVDTADLPVIATLPIWPDSKGNWSPTVLPFSLQPAYLVAGSINNTAAASLSLTNTQSVEHSVQIVTNCYDDTSAGKAVSWLSLSEQDVLLPANGSETINLTYKADDIAAGTYRAQLCLFSDFSYGSVSSIVQVQLIVLCSRYNHYETAPAGCNITFANISAASSSSSPASSPSSSPSSPSAASLDVTGSSLGPLAGSPAPEAASPSPQAASQSTAAGQRVTFSGTVAFDRPVVGAQSLQSLAGMMYAGGVANGRITEDTSEEANCGRYSITGYVLGNSDSSKPNITVSVSGLYDVTNQVNSCSSQAAY